MYCGDLIVCQLTAQHLLRAITALLAFLSELLQHYSVQFLVTDISEIWTVVGVTQVYNCNLLHTAYTIVIISTL